MTVTRKSVREVIENPQDDEYYVLVTRFVPNLIRFKRKKIKEVFDDWDRGLAPSKELLQKFKGSADWEAYVRQFKHEHPLWLIQYRISTHLINAGGKRVVLVCREEAGEYPRCHTWLILEMLKDCRVL